MDMYISNTDGSGVQVFNVTLTFGHGLASGFKPDVTIDPVSKYVATQLGCSSLRAAR